MNAVQPPRITEEPVSKLFNNRKALIAVALAVAFVAIVVPTCRMVGCSMDMAYMGFMHGGSELGLFSDCGGTFVTTTAPTAVVPGGVETLLLALMATMFAAITLFSPQVVARPVRIFDATPPPPPEEPRGERFRV